MLLPPQFKEEPLKTLGPPIRKEQENKPVEVEVSPGIWRVNGKLETRFPAPVLPMPVVIDYATIQTEVSEVDITLPEFKPVWRNEKPPLGSMVNVRNLRNGRIKNRMLVTDALLSLWEKHTLEWLDEGR